MLFSQNEGWIAYRRLITNLPPPDVSGEALHRTIERHRVYRRYGSDLRTVCLRG